MVWSIAAVCRSSRTTGAAWRQACRAFSSDPGIQASRPDEREAMEYDVCIVGAGPAGLSAAIRLKQLAKEKEQEISVCVLEKGSEVGAHILSGNVFQPKALDELIPSWREDASCPIHAVPAVKDRFYYLTPRRALRMPTPPQMHNKGNYVISLSEAVRWLGAQAEEAGVEIYPGFAGSHLLTSASGACVGVGTGDMGIGKDGTRKDSFAPGLDLRARVTLLAEGCRGSLTKEALKRYSLREKAGADPQTYALGLKEVWQIDPAKHEPGTVWHTLGSPLPWNTYGGGWLYHMADNRVSLGLVVSLDYSNPNMNLFQEFQQYKRHPAIARVLEGGTCLQYGARTLSEGGIQSIPALTFPGGALIGDGAGFLNVPKIKGTHTAMKSGMLAAEAAAAELAKEPTAAGRALDLGAYETAMHDSWVHTELHRERNIRPSFGLGAGIWGGLLGSALEAYVLRGKAPWTLRHRRPDHEALAPAAQAAPREYPKPDGSLTFDLNTSLFRSGTNHEHDQPPHLRLRNAKLPEAINLPRYGGPEARYCPAGVYEYVPSEHGGQKLQINAQNCLHCKACDIKDPTQNIQWMVPEGGGGPNYTIT
ncbi:FUO1 [Auxenochlorella protothecoides x Auxenochlorella symbiontica]